MKNNLNICLLIIAMLVSLLSPVASSESDAKKKITLKPKKINMYVGEQHKFSNKKCNWKSSNKKIVTVSKKGKIKAKKAGNAKITATLKGTRIKAVCKVKVGCYATGLKLKTAGSVILKLGQSSKINASVSPSKVLYTGISYKTVDSSIATVSNTGVITPVKPGITCVDVFTKAVTSSKQTINKTITVVVLASTELNTNKPEESACPVQDLITNVQKPNVIIQIGTQGATSSPEPTAATTPDVTDKPEPTSDAEKTPVPGETQTPSQMPHNTNPPGTPVPTMTPTAAPTIAPTAAPPLTVDEYIKTLVPNADSPIVASFAASAPDGTCLTYYLLNKAYTGNIKVNLDQYSYSGCGSVSEFLTKLKIDYGSKYTNSSNTIALYRIKKADAWTAEFIQTGVKYYFSGTLEDTVFNSPYGLMIANGNTLNNISIAGN